jgi:endonuclease-3
MTIRPARARAIMAKLETQHPGADTELHYRTAFELLVATILSAQSTDERVNAVTPALFAEFPDATALAAAAPGRIEPIILQTGFFRQKAKSIIRTAQRLVERHDGEVPAEMDALVALPGVGRKTANVVLGHALGIPGLPVDRHVLRVSNRIGLAEGEDPVAVEAQLCALLERERWTLASDTLILHGRRVCRPRPECERCVVGGDCAYFRALASDAAVRPVGRVAPTRRGGMTSPGTRGAKPKAPRTRPERPAAKKPRGQVGTRRPKR